MVGVSRLQSEEVQSKLGITACEVDLTKERISKVALLVTSDQEILAIKFWNF